MKTTTTNPFLGDLTGPIFCAVAVSGSKVQARVCLPMMDTYTNCELLTGTYNYYSPVYQRNQDPPKKYPMQYTTDLLWNKSMGFLDDARTAGGPFFLTMATVAPHNGAGYRPPGVPPYGPVPAAEYANAFPNEQVPRGKNFNPDVVGHIPLTIRTTAVQRREMLTTYSV